ncbi:hypothetical protein Tco_0682361 [Tanacetum coccineum]|uniref:Uncharacterized protein n=1 Tax=Tanacetum coccineum TaxID=301880 RepID=A0ABQ4XRJ2_9ASTR
MSTSKTYQQSLADAGSETRPPMLERGSYIPWASRFKRFLNRKWENRKWLLKALEDGPYVLRNITPTGNTSMGQCYNAVEKDIMLGIVPSQGFVIRSISLEQMLLAKQDEAGVILTDEQNDFLFADASRMEEIEELSANICLMARIQPADQILMIEPR